MKINLTLQLYKSKTYADGSHPITLMYTVNGKRIKKVIAKCKPGDWSTKANRVKSTALKAAMINSLITTEYAKAEELLYEIKKGNKSVSGIFRAADKFSLEQAFDAELARLEKEFKSGYYDKILAIKKQIKDLTIDVADIDEKWFNQMISDLEGLGNSANTIKKKIKLMRGVILRYSSQGVTKEIKAVTIPTTKSVKQKLNSDELSLLKNLPLIENDLMTATRDLFLMQVYLRGVRVGDVLQAYAKDFEDGRFKYKADKTDKELSIKLITDAQNIVDRYAGKHERLFPFFTWTPDKKLTKFENERARLKHKESCTTVINKYLKILAAMAGIKKPLSSHIARHTFARMAIDKINNPMVTMELLGHSSLAVHQNYLNDIRKDDELDQAADDIFG